MTTRLTNIRDKLSEITLLDCVFTVVTICGIIGIIFSIVFLYIYALPAFRPKKIIEEKRCFIASLDSIKSDCSQRTDCICGCGDYPQCTTLEGTVGSNGKCCGAKCVDSIERCDVMWGSCWTLDIYYHILGETEVMTESRTCSYNDHLCVTEVHTEFPMNQTISCWLNIQDELVFLSIPDNVDEKDNGESFALAFITVCALFSLLVGCKYWILGCINLYEWCFDKIENWKEKRERKRRQIELELELAVIP